MSFLRFAKQLRKVNQSNPIERTWESPRVTETAEQANIDQLKEGERSDGSLLPLYSNSSVLNYGKPKGRIKLFDTGDFYKSITAVPKKEGLLMIADTIKQAEFGQIDLSIIYEKTIVGVNKEGQEEVENEFKREFIRLYEKVFM